MLLGARNSELGVALATLGLSGKWLAIRHNRVDGFVLERAEPHTDPEPGETELLAALEVADKAALKAYAKKLGRQKAIALVAPGEAEDLEAAFLAIIQTDDVTELLGKVASGGTLTGEETTRVQDFRAMVATLRQTRQATVAILADITSGTITTRAQVDSDPRWPA
jgi:hypothetical protein